MADDGREFLPQLSATQYRGAVAVLGAIVFVVLVRLRFCYTPAVPPKPPKPKQVTTRTETTRNVATMLGDPKVYDGYLKQDATAAGVAAPSRAQMAARFPYRRATPNARLTLKGRSVIEAVGLRLEVIRRKHNNVWILALAIENQSHTEHLAYRVRTRPTSNGAAVANENLFCRDRELLPHNAVAIRAEQRILRTECIYRDGVGLEIVEVETISIPALSYYYVSKLIPTQLGLEARETANHRLPQGAGNDACNLVFSGSISRQIEQKQITWQNLVDYFARHNCAVYKSFPEQYKAFTVDRQRPLPIVP